MPVLAPEALTILSVAALVAALVALLAGTVALVRARRLRSRYDALLTGVDGRDLGRVLDAHIRRVAEAESGAQQVAARVDRLESRLAYAVQRLRLVRYAAFEERGDQSFSLALMDGRRDGAVLTGLVGRSGMRLYAKPLLDGRSPYALTTEEQEAVTEALERPEAVDSATAPSV